MKLLPQIKYYYSFILFLFLSYVSVAQTILTVNGAKMNMANAVSVSTNDLSVSGNGAVTVAASTIKIAGSVTSADAIDVSNGTVEMNGTAAQQLAAGSLTGKYIKALSINNTAGVTVYDTLKLTDVLTVSNGNLISGGFLTLKSSVTGTARVAPVTSLASAPITGDVIVERFIPPKRAFRFLTAPVNTAGSIRANWMEGVNNPNTTSGNIDPVPGFGTHITGRGGSANSFDETRTNNPSLFTYDKSTQAWVAATSPGSQMAAGTPYSILIRGSRSTNLNSNTPPASPTTLRAKGALVTGTMTLKAQGAGGTPGMPELSAATGAYTFIANPYASPVDWLLIDLGDFAGTMYIFDATIGGSNGRGGYVAFNRTIGVAGASSNDTSKIDNNIQSGQAFFVQTTGPAPSVTFKEPYKTGNYRAVFRSPNRMAKLSLHLLLTDKETGERSADGLAAYFSDDFSPSLGGEDSYKFTNEGENIAIERNGETLSIEGRKPVTASDTIPLKVWHLTAKNYVLKIALKNFAENINGYLEDVFLHTDTRLDNEGSAMIPFAITADTLSAASDRFRIIFKPSRYLLPLMPGIKAYAKDKGIEVEWTTGSENNTDRFEVEKSANAQQFAAAGLVNAKVNAGINVSSPYTWFDENPLNGQNYYRIKYFEKSGEVKFSKVVKVYMDINPATISVVSGGIKNSSLNIIFKNVSKGNYNVSLTNNTGQKIYEGSIVHNGGSANQSIKLKSYLAAGVYHLQVSGNDTFKNIPVLIQ